MTLTMASFYSSVPVNHDNVMAAMAQEVERVVFEIWKVSGSIFRSGYMSKRP